MEQLKQLADVLTMAHFAHDALSAEQRARLPDWFPDMLQGLIRDAVKAGYDTPTAH